jgi:hypothetical protein
MKSSLSRRIVLALLVAVLMPLEQAHCALMAVHSDPVALQTDHHADGDHACCPGSAPSHEPTTPADPCCCDQIPLPALTASASATTEAPASVATVLAIAPVLAATRRVRDAFVRIEPDARSGSPPDPSAAPQSPRSPPYSA